MLKTKTMERVCCVAAAVMLALSVALWGLAEPITGSGGHTVGYEGLLFDQSVVHTINITMSGWDDFIANATAEEYAECSLEIDGEKYSHVAIRAKGNTSLSSVSTLGSTRYSFKVEFDHFNDNLTYHGLDKLSLNNLIQDATMMKDYLAYTLMGRIGVPATLCSYVQINVNGEPWGLYLAVEGVEDSFLDRNGMTKGDLYKPDSLSFGGGRGNGRDFDFEQFRVKDDEETGDTAADTDAAENQTETQGQAGGMPFGGMSFGTPPDGSGGMPFNMPEGGFTMPEGGFTMPEGGFTMPEGMSFGSPDGESASDSESAADGESRGERPSRGSFDIASMGGGGFGGFNFGMGSEDVKLIYSDDDPNSYSNIFNNAKTKVTKKDKARLIESIRKLNEKEDIESVVDTDEVIRYLAVHNFLCNDDSYTGMMVHNYYLYEEKGQLSIIPWDYNLAFGGFSSSSNATSTVNSPIDSPVSGGTVDSRPLIAWIFSDEDYLNAYHETYSRFLEENIENGWLEEEILRVQAMISPYLESDASAFYDMETFEEAVNTLREFCAKRGESIRGQLDGTIPSTSADQRSSDALVDASDVSTSDMGSMGSGGGGGGFGGGMPGGGFTKPDSGSMPEGFTMPSGGGFTMPDSGSMPEGFMMPSGGSFTKPESTAATETEDTAATGTDSAATDAPSATAQPAKQAEAPQDRGSGRERPQSMPNTMTFPASAQADLSGQWITAIIAAAVLLLGILIIRLTYSHNQ